MKYLVLTIAFFILLSLKGRSQHIVEKRYLDIDIWDISKIDFPELAKKNITEINTYRCQQKNKDSCILEETTRFDKNGIRIENIVWRNAKLKQPDYVLTYRKLSDTSLEIASKLSEFSAPANGLYEEPTGRGKNPFALPGKNPGEFTGFVRSVLKYDMEGLLKRIDRYNMKDSLVSIWYPMGKDGPAKIVSDTIANEFGNKSIITIEYNELTTVKTEQLVDSKGRILKENTETANTKSSRKSLSTVQFFYNNDGYCVLKVYSGKDNSFTYSESFSYKSGRLVYYEKRKSMKQEPDITRKYDEVSGMLLMEIDRSSGSEIERKLIYNGSNLLVEQIVCYDGIPAYRVVHEYKSRNLSFTNRW